jgi:predicted phosphodiesterase
MRIAALYDVHGMPWALEAVLDDLGTVDAVVFGGDFCGGPYDQETLDIIDRLDDPVLIRGNVENDGPNAQDLPLMVELDGVRYCHATPTDNLPITTARTPDDDVVAMFGASGTFVIGHTHHQFDRRVGELRVINAGSVGMPYEGEVAAFWTLVVDSEPQFRRTSFDVAHAIERIEASSWPGAQAFADENLRVAVTREEAIAIFEEQRSASR